MTPRPLERGTILIAGGRGYLGSRLSVYLAETGWTVRVGSRGGTPIPGTADLPIEHHVIDWNSPASLEAACQGCHAVLHLAAPNEIVAGQSKVEAVNGTVLTTLAILDAARSAGCSRFLYFSTAHVYGSPLSGILDEERSAIPVHPYAIAHRCAEDFVLAHKSGPLRPIVVRLSNALGAPRAKDTDRWKLIGNDLCRQAVTSGCLTLQSDGKALRDFIPIRDVCRASEHLLEFTADVDYPVFNVGSGITRTVRDLAEIVAVRWHARTGHHLAASYGPPGGAPYDFEFPVGKLLSTGFSFESSLEEEIDLTLDRCAEWFGNEN